MLDNFRPIRFPSHNKGRIRELEYKVKEEREVATDYMIGDAISLTIKGYTPLIKIAKDKRIEYTTLHARIERRVVDIPVYFIEGTDSPILIANEDIDTLCFPARVYRSKLARPDGYVTVFMYSKKHGITKSTLYRRIRKGALEAIKVDGRLLIKEE